MRLEEQSVRALIARGQTLSLAESCTGGLLAHRLTNVPGSSACFRLGLITYSNESKSSLLQIPPQIIQKYGAVSEETAELMARNVRKAAGTDFGIGITGIAGPSGATKTKSVGLTYIAVSTKAEALCLKCIFSGSRLQIKSQAATQALSLLLEFLVP